MKTFTFYDAKTGHFTGRRINTTSLHALELNTPAGLVAIEGHYDPLSQRVDIATGEVIDYQPPQPDNNHEWNAESKRWALNAEAQERRVRRVAALDRIALLERQQARPSRELYLDPDNSEARARLEAIETEISELRSVLR